MPSHTRLANEIIDAGGWVWTTLGRLGKVKSLVYTEDREITVIVTLNGVDVAGLPIEELKPAEPQDIVKTRANE